MIFFKFGYACILLLVGLAEFSWGATIAIGDVTAHWSGKGRLFDMENYRKFSTEK